MITGTLFELDTLLQTIALALSIFNLITFLWLALTVWLNGNRQSMIARVGVVGLGLSALFFFIHALLVTGPLNQSGGLINTETLWHLIWFPALGVPYIWFVIGLHYASLMNEKWNKRRPLLLISSAFLGCSVLSLLILNRSLFTFHDTILFLSLNILKGEPHSTLFSPIIWLPAGFLFYVTVCAIGPWFTPDRIGRLLRALWQAGTGRLPLRHRALRAHLADVFWHDQTAINTLEEPALSWHLARPGLLVAALLMVTLTAGLAILGIWAVVRWLGQTVSVLPSITTLNRIPVNLLYLNICALGAVALIVLLIGYSITRHGILVERPLARRGFFEQWRGIVIVATTIAIFIAILSGLTRSSLGGMLLVTAIATGTYALFTWSNYTAHDRYIALLTPFLRTTNVRHWLNTDLQKTELSMESLFSHFCQKVLQVKYARLVILAGPVRHSFEYHWPASSKQHAMTLQEYVHHPDMPASSLHIDRHARIYRLHMTVQGKPELCWVLPLYDELGLVANLYLGPRADGGVFTNEDMDLALACGQRILNTLRDHEAMLTVASLLRRRIVDVKLLGAQQRRVLHDEILPILHLALLRLETLRSFTVYESETEEATHALTDVIQSISDAHRQLATMMRTMGTSAPHRLERDGLMDAIHTMLVQDFQHAFDKVQWQVPDEEARRIDEMVPPAIAELIFAAVQETLRNAARHARGNDLHRHISVTLSASCNPDLEVLIADDGVGIVSASSSTSGTGGGISTHSALLAIAGGNLSIKSAPDAGVRVRILLPVETLR